MTYFQDLLKEVETGKANINGLNYKTKVICQLNKSPNFTQTKENLCIGLSESNPDKPHPYFMSHPTVFDVLSKRKGLIVKVGDSYKLAGKLTPAQSKEIMAKCTKKLRALN